MNVAALKDMIAEMLRIRSGQKEIDFIDALNIAQTFTQTYPDTDIEPRTLAEKFIEISKKNRCLN